VVTGTSGGSRHRRRSSPVAVAPEPGRVALTVPQSAYELNCSPNTVWNLVATGQLESFKLGRKRLIARTAIESFIARGGTDDRQGQR